MRYDLYGTPDADPNAPVATSREFASSSSNFAPRLGAVWTLGESRRIGAARQHRPDVRPDAQRRSTSRRCKNDGTNARASATFTPTQAGAPAFPAVLSAGAGAAPNTGVDGRSRLQGRALVAEQRAVRAGDRRSLLAGGRRVVREGLRPAGRHEHQPDQPDRHAGRRPADLRAPRSTRRPASIRATT